MKFNKDRLLARFQEIGTKGTIEEIRAELGVLQGELVEDYSEHETIVAERDQLTSDNETLRKANNKLFLQIGGKEPEKDKTPPAETKKFEDLFDEKGGLK